MTSAPTPAPGPGSRADDLAVMRRAVDLAAAVRPTTSPNPWVGCVVVSVDGRRYEGATEPPGGRHAEAVALDAAGDEARGATVYVTLEPCDHHGRTPPCASAVAAAGVRRVVAALEDPDPQVAGRGFAALRRHGVEVVEGVGAAEAAEQLAPYLKHRRTGRPWVVLKLAATLDGGIAAPDGSSKWITGPEARADSQQLRAESDAILVGAGTVRVDDPALTVRIGDPGAPGAPGAADQPLRVVLGRAGEGARVLPAIEYEGDVAELLDQLGSKGVVQLLVEGGADVAHQFHSAGLVDRYVLYLAPALFGGSDALGMFCGPGAPSMDDLWRGRLVSVARVGEDLRLELAPAGAGPGGGGRP